MTDTQHPHDREPGLDTRAEVDDEPTPDPDTRAEVDDELAPDPDTGAQAQLVAPPVTGDAGVDRVLKELQERLQDGPDEQVAAVTEAHRQLQARLTTPAPPAPPGQARPGPR